MKQNYNISVVYKKLLLLLTVGFLFSCQTNGYKKFYKSDYSETEIEGMKKTSRFQFLEEDEEPLFYAPNSTALFKKSKKSLLEKNFITIGISGFNGPYESSKNALSHARDIGAVAVLLSDAEYTNTVSRVHTYTVPDTKTITESGTVSGKYGEGPIEYSGKSTIKGEKTKTYTTHTKEYDQGAIYFIYDKTQYKFGLLFKNISRKQRIEIGSRGVQVELIYKKFPVYQSDILEQDIVINVDGHNVENQNQFGKLLTATNKNPSIWTIIRNGEQRKLSIVWKSNKRLGNKPQRNISSVYEKGVLSVYKIKNNRAILKLKTRKKPDFFKGDFLNLQIKNSSIITEAEVLKVEKNKVLVRFLPSIPKSLSVSNILLIVD